jgi:hypothetical protein
MAELFGVPGGGEVWKIGSSHFLVYKTPKHGVPIAYSLEDKEQLERLFRNDFETRDVKVARTFGSMADAEKKSGVLLVGSRHELRNREEHPFSGMVAKFDRLVLTQPWLKDPEVLALHAASQLEGRPLTEQELRSTDWWRSRGDGEREWALLSLSDPETAKQVRRDNSFTILNTLQQLGAANVPHDIRAWINTQWTTGKWSQPFLTEQLRRLADPYRGALAPGLQALVQEQGYDISGRGGENREINITREHVDTVRDMVSRWLGPHVAESWDPEKVREWAGRLRNDPNAHLALTDTLRKQRLAKYKGYEDINTTYEDIDALWRPVFRTMWGQDPESGDPLFEKILQLNDAQGAETLLRREGIRQGNRTVGMSLIQDMHRAMGGSVREMR